MIIADLRSTEKGSYFAGIDGLRGVAVLAVLVYHLDAAYLKGGFSGVDVFFVISGYVVTKSLLSHWHTGEGLLKYLAAFYVRRIVRLMPALLVCLIVTSVAVVLFIPNAWLSDNVYKTGLFSYFGLGNLALVSAGDSYYAARAEFNPFTHTWSLAVEEQFYLAFPLIVYLWMLRFCAGSVWVKLLVRNALVLLAVLSLAYAWRETVVDHNSAFYLIFSRFWELAAGALLYQFHRGGALLPRKRLSTDVSLVFGLVLVGISFILSEPKAFPAPMALLPVFGALFVIAAVASPSAITAVVTRWVLGNDVITYIGRMSYSLYLWHWPVFVLARWTIGLDGGGKAASAVCLAFILSAVSYHCVETPTRVRCLRLGVRQMHILLSGIALAVSGWGGSSLLFSFQDGLSLSVTRNREVWYPYPWPQPSAGGGFLEGKTLFVAGDSHAAAYGTMLQQLVDNDRLAVHVIQKPGCAIAKLLQSVGPECANFVETSISEIESKGRAGDVVFLPGLRVGRLMTDQTVYDDADLLNSMYSERAAKEFGKALSEARGIIWRLESKGLRVIVEAPKPVFKAMPYRCSDWFNASNPICKAGLGIDRSFLATYRKPIMDSIGELKSSYPNLIVWDPFPVLCPDSVCWAVRDGEPLFFDSDHLSANGNRILYFSFRSVLISLFLKDIPQYRSLEMRTSRWEGVKTVGVADAEPWGRWTDGDDVAFSFSAPLPQEGFRFVVDVDGAFSTIQGTEVVASAGDRDLRFVAPAERERLVLDFRNVGQGVDTVRFRLAGTRSPKALGLSDDPRALGLALVRVEVVRLQDSGD